MVWIYNMISKLKLSNEHYLIFAALGELLIATIYVLIGLSNYSVGIPALEFTDELRNVELFRIHSDKVFDPRLTWAPAVLSGILFAVYGVIWKEHKVNPKPDLQGGFYGVGACSLCLMLSYRFLLGYSNDVLLIAGTIIGTAHLMLFVAYEIREGDWHW